METKIGCVIMASGLAKRFGSNKLLHEWNGKPMIIHTLNVASVFSSRVVVTRHRQIEQLCTRHHIPVLLHAFPNRNDTIRLGLRALLSWEPQLAGCIFIAADQPRLQRTSIENLCRSFHQAPECIHRLSFRGEPGSPVIFPKSCFAELMALPEGAGGSYLMRACPEMVRFTEALDERELLDVDTPEMLALL